MKKISETMPTPSGILANYFLKMERIGRRPTIEEVKAFSPYVSKGLINRLIEHIRHCDEMEAKFGN